jgi:putative glutathione S-transferase
MWGQVCAASGFTGGHHGLLIDGVWRDQWYDTKSTGGAFKRQESQFRNWVTRDGAPGPSGDGGFKAESGRYHLYVSHACPWANRTMIFRSIKGLEDHIGVVGGASRHAGRWLDLRHRFRRGHGRCVVRIVLHAGNLPARRPGVTTRVTVPVLWDTETGRIVSNESAEIIRMFNSAFDGITGNTLDFYPEELRDRIDAINARVYSDINNGVYKSGFATSQAAYDKAVHALFEALDWVEGILADNRYLAGDRITEADWRLFTTLVRFDSVYHLHFKCNRRRLIDYPNLWGYHARAVPMAGRRRYGASSITSCGTTITATKASIRTGSSRSIPRSTGGHPMAARA